ncbi:MAG TPA: hypothetical protein VKR78_04595, partial [Acidimicrobiales bacterium]|nr:hypothetical protein [Acidimicrobiales bacterium]
TVIWDFAGERLDDPVRESVARLLDEPLPGELEGLLDDEELEALVVRARALARAGRLPKPGSGRPYPWPLV